MPIDFVPNQRKGKLGIGDGREMKVDWATAGARKLSRPSSCLQGVGQGGGTSKGHTSPWYRVLGQVPNAVPDYYLYLPC